VLRPVAPARRLGRAGTPRAPNLQIERGEIEKYERKKEMGT
jgi:hypothetical protein